MRGLGITTVAASGNEVIRWKRAKKYLADLHVIADTDCDAPKYICETIVYRLAMKAKNQVAERFQAFIAEEVAPSIRKSGSYVTGQGIMDALSKNPRDLANLLNKYADAVEQKAALEAQIEADKPKVEFAERLSVSEGTVTIKQFAALLCQKGYRTGEIRMFEELRQDGFLLTNGSYKNEPAQKYLEMRIFEVRTYDYTKGMTNYFGRQPVITAKGIDYLLDYYMRKHGLMPLLSIHRKPLIPRPTLKQLKAGHSNS